MCDAWIQFWGSVIGGLATLIGVAVTICHYSSIQKKERRQNIKPVLFCRPNLSSMIDPEKSSYQAAEIFIKNCGLGAAIDIQIEKTTLFGKEIDYQSIDGFSLSQDSETNYSIAIFHDSTRAEIEEWARKTEPAYILLGSTKAESALCFDLKYFDSMNTKYKCKYICDIFVTLIEGKYKLALVNKIINGVAEEV